MRVPPDQSGAAATPGAAPGRGWPCQRAGQPGQAGGEHEGVGPGAPAPRRAAGAGRRGRTGAIEPDTSASRTRWRGRSVRRRNDRRTGSPPVARARRSVARRSSRRPRGWRTVRRLGRRGVAHGSAAMRPASVGQLVGREVGEVGVAQAFLGAGRGQQVGALDAGPPALVAGGRRGGSGAARPGARPSAPVAVALPAPAGGAGRARGRAADGVWPRQSATSARPRNTWPNTGVVGVDLVVPAQQRDPARPVPLVEGRRAGPGPRPGRTGRCARGSPARPPRGAGARRPPPRRPGRRSRPVGHAARRRSAQVVPRSRSGRMRNPCLDRGRNRLGSDRPPAAHPARAARARSRSSRYLSTRPERGVGGIGVEAVEAQQVQRRHPVDRLGQTRRLLHVERAQALHRRRHLLGQRRRRHRHPPADDRHRAGQSG